MKKKTAKKPVRKVTKVVPVAAKTKLPMAKVRGLEKVAEYVPRAQLQSAMAKYRMAMARFNSKHTQVKLLQSKVCNLECRIEELKRELAAAKTTPQST